MDRMDKGMFPGVRDDVGNDAGVDKVEKDVGNGVKGQFENPNAETVGSAGRGVSHSAEYFVQCVGTNRVKPPLWVAEGGGQGAGPEHLALPRHEGPH